MDAQYLHPLFLR